ncbi:helix-turn-helix domain-containing protein [Sphingopyxis sp. 113P3]|nr:helix-turn-helix domain-containing protein [Sphingopyxis sp. 113P3]
MEERMRFVVRLLDGEPMSELCREFGISEAAPKMTGQFLTLM